MSNTPRGAVELAEGQALPETTVNEQIRRTEAGAMRYVVADIVTAPPGTCADGAAYLIVATATDAFAGKEDQIAVAVGTNAASGWLYRIPGSIDKGLLAYVQDDDDTYEWNGSAFALVPSLGDIPTNFTDLDDTPSAYTGLGGFQVRVKGDESGLEFLSVAEAAYADSTTDTQQPAPGGTLTTYNSSTRWRLRTTAAGASGGVSWGFIVLRAIDGTAGAPSSVVTSSELTGFEGDNVTDYTNGTGWKYDSGAEAAVGSTIELVYAAPFSAARLDLFPLAFDYENAPEGWVAEYWDGSAWQLAGSWTKVWTSSDFFNVQLAPATTPGTSTGGATPPAGGDYLVSTDNLADLDDAATARTNLGLGSAATAALIDEDDMASDSATAVPTQQSVKAYVDAEVAGAGGAATSQPGEQISGFIASPSNKSYTICLDMKHAGTITEVTTKSASGTCTATWKINSTALGGTANSVSSSEQTQSHSTSNTFSAGDDIVLTVSSNATCTDMSFTIKYTRTLA